MDSFTAWRLDQPDLQDLAAALKPVLMASTQSLTLCTLAATLAGLGFVAYHDDLFFSSSQACLGDVLYSSEGSFAEV